jgi:hypothetical protein
MILDRELFTVMQSTNMPLQFLFFHLVVAMTSKEKILLDLDAKVNKASENDKLSVKEIVMKFNNGKTQVTDILKVKSEIEKQWPNCGSGSMKQKLRKTRNEDIDKIVGVGVVCKCKSWKLSNTWTNETETFKRSG